MHRRFSPFISVLAVGWGLAVAQPVPADAAPRPIQLEDAPPADAARELQYLLEAPVEIRGGEGRKVNLALPANASPFLALDRVAAQLGGSWRMKLHVMPGKPEALRQSPLIDRSMALGLQDITAERAFSLVARDLKADLELEGELKARVAVIVVNVTANVVLDRIAEQAGATWDVSYIIDAPNVPQPILVKSRRTEPSVVPPPVPMPEPLPAPMPPVPAPVASAADLLAELRSGINLVVRAEPARRSDAVREFLQRGEALVALLNTLSPVERLERQRALLAVIKPWRRLYQGLAPNVHKELAPVAALLDRLSP